MPVSLQELLDALDNVSMDDAGDNRAAVCRQTGKLYFHFDEMVFGDLSEAGAEWPDDADDPEKYAEVPHKRTLGLGKPLALSFAGEHLAEDFDEVRTIFSKRGAYAKFRGLVERRRVLQLWYDYEAAATARALREWCADNSLEVTD
jgi:hypothetical protein